MLSSKIDDSKTNTEDHEDPWTSCFCLNIDNVSTIGGFIKEVSPVPSYLIFKPLK
jgi:hypothetical protein